MLYCVINLIEKKFVHIDHLKANINRFITVHPDYLVSWYVLGIKSCLNNIRPGKQNTWLDYKSHSYVFVFIF